MDYSSAYSLSRDLLKRIAPACLRIETVGSVKRGDPKACANGVHDIEFLIIPDPARVRCGNKPAKEQTRKANSRSQSGWNNQ